MFTLNKNNENVSNLIKFLQDTSPKNRLVAYYALAEFLVPYLLSVHKDGEATRKALKDSVWKINELAIVDKTLLERILMTTLDYKLFKSTGYSITGPNDTIMRAVCFQDLLGISKFYTAEDIHTINLNFNLFKQVAVEVAAIISKERERLVGRVTEAGER